MNPTVITLCFLAFAIIMFVLEKIPLGLTATIVSVGLCVTGVLEPKQAFAGYVDSNVILCVAMFVVGQALFETGMANKIGGLVTKFAKSERQLIIAIMVITGLMSGFLSNTGSAAVLIPVVVGIAAESGYSRSHLLMPLVFAAALGGNISIIGAPGNLMGVSALNELGIETSFFEYLIVGGPMMLAGILYFALFGYKLLPKNSGAASLEDDQFAVKDYSDVPKWKQYMSLAQGLGADPRAVVIATVIAGSCAYATPIGMPANTMVVGIGGYKFIDYVKAGLPLILVSFIICMVILPVAYPFFPA